MLDVAFYNGIWRGSFFTFNCEISVHIGSQKRGTFRALALRPTKG